MPFFVAIEFLSGPEAPEDGQSHRHPFIRRALTLVQPNQVASPKGPNHMGELRGKMIGDPVASLPGIGISGLGGDNMLRKDDFVCHFYVLGLVLTPSSSASHALYHLPDTQNFSAGLVAYQN